LKITAQRFIVLTFEGPLAPKGAFDFRWRAGSA